MVQPKIFVQTLLKPTKVTDLLSLGRESPLHQTIDQTNVSYLLSSGRAHFTSQFCLLQPLKVSL